MKDNRKNPPPARSHLIETVAPVARLDFLLLAGLALWLTVSAATG